MSKNDSSSNSARRCQAMIDAGIENPDSIEGALFCAGSRDDSIKSRCPYEYCVVFEHPATSKTRQVNAKAQFVKNLRSHGVSLEDIALILHTSMRTAQRYLKR